MANTPQELPTTEKSRSLSPSLRYHPWLHFLTLTVRPTKKLHSNPETSPKPPKFHCFWFDFSRNRNPPSCSPQSIRWRADEIERASEDRSIARQGLFRGGQRRARRSCQMASLQIFLRILDRTVAVDTRVRGLY